MKRMTRNRAELLRLFFTNPDGSFYMQEIGRNIGKKPGCFQRTINSMEKEGILKSERSANARYFRINKDYPLYDEMKNIIFKTIGVIGSIRKVLQKIGGVKLAFVYGSYAKGEDNYLSDIDMVVVGITDEDMMIKEFDSLEELFKRDVNYKLYEQAEFKKEIRKKEPFLINILKDKKVMVIGEEDELRKICKG